MVRADPGGDVSRWGTSRIRWWDGSDELPVHRVYVSAFYMGKYEVTKELWDDGAGVGLEQRLHGSGGGKWRLCLERGEPSGALASLGMTW